MCAFAPLADYGALGVAAFRLRDNAYVLGRAYERPSIISTSAPFLLRRAPPFGTCAGGAEVAVFRAGVATNNCWSLKSKRQSGSGPHSDKL